MFTERYPARCDELTEHYGVPGVTTQEAARDADVLSSRSSRRTSSRCCIAEPPPITPGTLVVSLAPGIPTSLYEKSLPAGPRWSG